jgi:membrane protein required for beta-lactamase induction
MTLIAILIGILIDRFYQALPALRHYRFFHEYVAWMRARLQGEPWSGALGLLVLLLPPLLLVAVLQSWFSGGLWSLIGLLFGIAVLVFTLGPRDLPQDVDDYCAVHGDMDDEARRAIAREFQPGLADEADTRACDEAVLRGVLVGAHDRWFGVIFWFALLGPLGAVLFRAVEQLAREPVQDDFGATVQQLHGILGWLPTRLMVVAYALSGHFEQAVHAWRGVSPVGGFIAQQSEAVLLAAGEGALCAQCEECLDTEPVSLIRSAMGLVWRALLVWLAVIAVMILAGWLS